MNMIAGKQTLEFDIYAEWEDYSHLDIMESEIYKEPFAGERFQRYIQLFGMYEDIVLKTGAIVPYFIEEYGLLVQLRKSHKELYSVLKSSYTPKRFVEEFRNGDIKLMTAIREFAEFALETEKICDYTVDQLFEGLTKSLPADENKKLLRILGLVGMPRYIIQLMAQRMQNCTTFDLLNKEDPDDFCFLLAMEWYADANQKMRKPDGNPISRKDLYEWVKEQYNTTQPELPAREYELIENSVSIQGTNALFNITHTEDPVEKIKKCISYQKHIVNHRNTRTFEKQKRNLWNSIEKKLDSQRKILSKKMKPIWTTLRFYFQDSPIEILSGTRVVAYHLESGYFYEFETARFEYSVSEDGKYADVVARSYDVSERFFDGKKLLCVTWLLDGICNVTVPYDVYVGSIPVRFQRTEFDSENQDVRFCFELDGKTYCTDVIHQPRKYSYCTDIVGGGYSRQLTRNQVNDDSITLCGKSEVKVTLDGHMDKDNQGTKGKFIVTSEDELDIRKYTTFLADEKFYYRAKHDVHIAMIETYAIPCKDNFLKQSNFINRREVEKISVDTVSEYDQFRHFLLGLNGYMKLDEAVKEGYYDRIELLLWNWNLPIDIKKENQFKRTHLLVLAFWDYVLNNEKPSYEGFVAKVNMMKNVIKSDRIELDNQKVQLLVFIIRCLEENLMKKKDIPEIYQRLHQLSLYKIYQKKCEASKGKGSCI